VSRVNKWSTVFNAQNLPAVIKDFSQRINYKRSATEYFFKVAPIVCSFSKRYMKVGFLHDAAPLAIKGLLLPIEILQRSITEMMGNPTK